MTKQETHDFRRGEYHNESIAHDHLNVVPYLCGGINQGTFASFKDRLQFLIGNTSTAFYMLF